VGREGIPERGVREIRFVDPKIQNNRTAEEKYMENIRTENRKVNIENLFGARSGAHYRAPADTGAPRHPSASEGLNSSLVGRPGDLWG